MTDNEWSKKISDECYSQHSSYEGWSEFNTNECANLIAQIRAESENELSALRARVKELEEALEEIQNVDKLEHGILYLQNIARSALR